MLGAAAEALKGRLLINKQAKKGITKFLVDMGKSSLVLSGEGRIGR
jgi:hypothetical protein